MKDNNPDDGNGAHAINKLKIMGRSRKETAEILIQNILVYGWRKPSLFIQYPLGSLQKFYPQKTVLKKSIFIPEPKVVLPNIYHIATDPAS